MDTDEQKRLILNSDIEPSYAPEIHQLATRIGLFGYVRTQFHVLEMIDKGWIEVVMTERGLHVRATPAGLKILE